MSLRDSQLKFFTVEVIDIDWGRRTKALLITCPRCKHEGIVAMSWKNSSKFGTRPCTYCFKTSRIPKRKDWS